LVLPAIFRTPKHLIGPLKTALELYAIQVMLDLVTEGCEACLEGLQRVDLSRAIDTVRRTIVAALASGAALSGAGLRGVAVASLGGSLVGFMAGALVLLPRIPRRVGARLSPSQARTLLAYGKKVALLRPFGILQRAMDRLVVGALLGPTAVALVEVATQLQSGADAILSASSYAVVPGASWLAARDDRSALRSLVERGTRYSVLLTTPLVIATAVLAGPIVRVWVGGRYHDAIGLVPLAVLSVALAAPLAVGSNCLLGVGRATTILRAASIATILNLVCTIVLVHLIGIVGAFEATLIGCVVLAALLGPAVLAEVGLSPRGFLRSAVAPAVAPAVALCVTLYALLASHQSALATLIEGIVVGGAVYAVAAVRWGFDHEERAQLASITRRRLDGVRGARA
jgi:O-antigen/teichoic acid export membrane protein